MPAAIPYMARVGDVTVGLGKIEANPVPIVGIFINTLPAAAFLAPVTPHFGQDCEAGSVVTEGCLSVFVNKQPATFAGAETLCGHPILTGAMNVIVRG